MNTSREYRCRKMTDMLVESRGTAEVLKTESTVGVLFYSCRSGPCANLGILGPEI